MPTIGQPPTANAGLDQTVTDSDGDGFAQVALDGSGSSDPDGTIVSYEWFEGASLLASGVSPSAALPVGAHPLRLVVTDDDGLTAEDEVVVTINEPTFLDSCPDGDAQPNVIVCTRLDTNGVDALGDNDLITIASGGDVRGVVTGAGGMDTITVETGGRVEGLVRGYKHDDTLILREGGSIRDGLDGDGGNDTFMVEASGGLTLVGDSGNDRFIFNGDLTGTYNVSGSSDSDTLDCRGLTFAVTVTSTGTAQGIVEGNGGQFRVNYTGIQHVLTPP